ncbi:MAG: methyltransferase [Gemmatimonadaceae bacterium]
MTSGERIAADLRRAWNGAPWHGPSGAEIAGRLDARQAATRRARGSHTPWQLVLHLTVWAETPRRRIDDPSYDPPVDFPEPASAAEPQWARDVAVLGETIESLAARVAAMPDEQLAAQVGERGYTYATMFDGVAQHLAYHSGQIALLALHEETAGVLLPPLVIVPGAMALAEVLGRAFGAHFVRPDWLGWVLLVAGLGLLAWANRHFVKHRTPAAPWRAARMLVSDGPFRVTRNPMYIGALLIQAGVGCLRSNPLYIILLIPTWALLHWGVVRREERYLLKKFGAPYQRFMDTTRRWLF